MKTLSLVEIFTNMLRKQSKHRYRGNYPLQHLSHREKTDEWAMDCMDYFSSTNLNNTDIAKASAPYRWYNSIIDDEEFNLVTNPTKTTVEKFKHMPAKLKCFPIIGEIIDTLITEWRNTPINYQVKILNEDAINEYRREQEKVLRETYEEVYVSIFQGQDIPDEEIKSRIEKKVKSLPSLRAKEAQRVLRYLMQDLKVLEKSALAFKHYLIWGRAITFKNVEDADIEYNIINPLYATSDFDNNEFFENADYFSVYLGENGQGLTMSQIHDLFKDEPLTEEEIKDLTWSAGNLIDAPTVNGDILSASYNRMYTSLSYGDVFNSTAKYQVQHTVWRSYAKKGKLTYIDPLTKEEQVMEVPEEYKKKQGEKIEHFWEEELWEGYCISGRAFKRLRRYPYIRKPLQKGNIPLPYNGISYSNLNAPNTSPVKLLIPYQILTIIIYYRIELAMAKNIGKVAKVYSDEIPSNMGMDGFLYYARIFGFAIVERPKNPNMGNAAKDLDFGSMQEIMQWIGFLDFINGQAKQQFGMTPQRLGQIGASAQVGTTNAAIQQGKAITGESVARFVEFLRRDVSGLVDISKYAWRNGKKATYLSSDDRKALEEIDELSIPNLEMGIDISASNKDAENLRLVKELVHPFAQNGGNPKMVASMAIADSLVELKEQLEEMESDMDRRSQEAQKGEQANIQAQKESEKEIMAYKAQLDKEIEAMKIEGELAVAREKNKIEVTPNTFDQASFNDYQKTRDTLANSEKDSLIKAKTEIYKADTQKEIAKENKNKYDK